MKNKKRIIVISIVAILCLCMGYLGFNILYSTGSKNALTNYVQGEQDSIKVPLEIDGLHTFVGLIDGNIIYQSIGDGTTTFYSYNMEANTQKEFDTIENYFLNGKRSTLIDDCLYFYVTIVQNEVFEDRFYTIDLEKDELVNISKDETYFHIIPVATINEQVIALKSDYEEENGVGTTDLIIYEPATQEEKEVVSRQIDYENSNGEVMINFDVEDDRIYVLTEIGKDGDVESIIEVYDKDYNLINTISVEAIDDIVNQAISDFKIIGDYVFINNASNNGVIAKINGSKLEVVLKDTDIDIAINHTDESLNRYVFYKRQTNEYYVLDMENGLETITVDIEPGSVIRCILADENGVLIVLNKEEKKDTKESTQTIYYFDNSHF